MSTKTEHTIEKLNEDQVLALLSVRREEWKYRDGVFTTMFWRFAMLSLIVIFFPNLANKFGIEGLSLLILPPWMFSAFGIVVALFGMYISMGIAARMEAVDSAIEKIEKRLPDSYQYVKVKNFKVRLTNVLCIGFYSAIILVAIVNILYLI